MATLTSLVIGSLENLSSRLTQQMPYLMSALLSELKSAHDSKFLSLTQLAPQICKQYFSGITISMGAMFIFPTVNILDM